MWDHQNSEYRSPYLQRTFQRNKKQESTLCQDSLLHVAHLLNWQKGVNCYWNSPKVPNFIIWSFECFFGLYIKRSLSSFQWMENLPTHIFSCICYNWPLYNVGIRNTPCHSQKCTYNIGLPKNLTTHSLLLTQNLANNMNSGLTHILYVICMIYCVLTIK